MRLVPAVSTEEAISFRQIHEPSGSPIKYVKGVRDGETFTEVPDEEIIKDYEHGRRIRTAHSSHKACRRLAKPPKGRSLSAASRGDGTA